MKRSDPGTSRLWRDRGAAAVEMALIMPLLLMIVCAIIDFGLMYNAQITLTQASREGARVVAYDSTATHTADQITASAQARVKLAADGLPSGPDKLNKPVVSVEETCPNHNPDPIHGDVAKVTVTYTYTFVTPFAVLAGMFSGPAQEAQYTMTSTAVVTCSG